MSSTPRRRGARQEPAPAAGGAPGVRPFRVALAAWEIGRPESGLGTKIGGLGQVVEELPPELVQAAAAQGLALEVETLSPCFAHYDRRRLRRLDCRAPATIEGHSFAFEVYEHVFTERLVLPGGARRDVACRMIYFWDHGQLHWTNAGAVYPDDPWLGLKLYAAVGQAMAAYIRQGDFQTIHLHDYHVGLIPFYLDEEYLQRVPVHLTVHNASYQGITPLRGGGYASLGRLNLPGDKLFHKYFDFFDNLNPLKACLLRVHELGGRVTTVSGDLAGSWGYAAELRENHAALAHRAAVQKGRAAEEVFVPNRHLDVFEKIPVAGITNGLSARNRPEEMPELRGAYLRELQARRGAAPLFAHPCVQAEMLSRDHHFDAEHLARKQELRRLLYLEAFGHEIWGHPALFSAVGRLVEQKNFHAVAGVIEPVLRYDPEARFIILAAAPGNDADARGLEGYFQQLAQQHPGRVYFNHSFHLPLSKLILGGSDFTLIPSKFEPCGLVDYEAALLGTIPIARATGGLPKTRHCGYLYEWLDARDTGGEVQIFFRAIQAALDVFRRDYGRHQALMCAAMRTEAGWEKSAAQYVELYRYGLLAKKWHAARREWRTRFVTELGRDRELFRRFFAPGQGEYGDRFDWQLREKL